MALHPLGRAAVITTVLLATSTPVVASGTTPPDPDAPQWPANERSNP